MEAEAAIPELLDDGLAEVLAVLPPRSLALARCVCKAWRDVVDARALLHPHLLPRSVRGIFLNYIDHYRLHLFTRPSTSSSTFPTIDGGMMDFLPNDAERDWWTVLDHCNGLVLCNIDSESVLCVCNPATRRWTLLPGVSLWNRYIAFDPVVSPHYEVVTVPDVPGKPRPPAPPVQPKIVMEEGPFLQDCLFFASPVEDDQQQPAVQAPPASAQQTKPAEDPDPCRLMEWPPSPWTLQLFSSTTGLWEDRSFVRESQPVGIVEDMRLDPRKPTWRGPRQRYAVYHNGGLYVHSRGSFLSRFSLSGGTYQVIKMPIEEIETQPYLGRSEHGVYFGIVDERRQLRVWVLNESGGHLEWLLKYEVGTAPCATYIASLPYDLNGRQPDGSWMVE